MDRNAMTSAAGNSYWEATSTEGAEYKPLDGEARCDVAIVGGGFAGLSAAHHLAAAGTEPLVLEAADIGAGASGRTAGFAVLRYRRGFASLAARFGTETARQLHALLLDCLAILDEFTDAYGLSQFVDQSGHLTAAHSPAALRGLEADLSWLAAEAGDKTPRLLDRKAMAAAMGSESYSGGYDEPRARSLHPLGWVRGLAAGLASRGIRIHTRSPATRFARDGDRVFLETPGGRVTARKVIFATNGYSEATMPGDIFRRAVPVHSSVIVTQPMAPELQRVIIPARRAVTDTKRLVNGFRILPDGRLLCAGRGDITGRHAAAASAYRPLEEDLAAIFPNLRDVAIAYRWSGRIAVPLGDLPHVGTLAQDAYFVTGCGGRGVLLMHGLGRMVAQKALGERVAPSPITADAAPIPFHGLRVPVLRFLARYYRIRDWLDSRAAAGAAERAMEEKDA